MSKNQENLTSPDRATVAGWVTKDIEIVVSFMNLVRNNPEILNGVIDVIYARVQAEQEAKEAQPELFDSNG